jgi:hypothetical protein
MATPPDYDDYFMTGMNAKRVEYLFVVTGAAGRADEHLPYVRFVPVHAMTFSAKPGYVVNPDALPDELKKLIW